MVYVSGFIIVSERTSEPRTSEPANERTGERTNLKHKLLFLYNNWIRNDNCDDYGWVGKPTVPDFHDHRSRTTKQ